MALYFIKESADNKIILENPGDGALAVLFVLVGSLFALIGLYLVHPNYSLGEFAGWALLFMGTFAIVAGLFAPSQGKKNYPKNIIFDNNTGNLIFEPYHGKTTAVVPYDELEKFSIRTVSRSDPHSSVDSNYFDYVIYLQKKDGATYDFFVTASEKKANELLSKLEAGVKLDVTPEKLTDPILPAKLQKANKAQAAGIKWANHVRGRIIAFPFITLIIAIPYYLIIQAVNDSYLLIGIVSLFAFSFYGILFWNFYTKTIKHLNVVYAVYISSGYFEFAHEDDAGRTMKSIKIPLKEINSIILEFNISDVQESFIKIATHSEVDEFKELDDSGATFSNLLKAIKLSSNQIKLETQGLSFVEKLNLENWLQQEVRKHHEMKVL